MIKSLLRYLFFLLLMIIPSSDTFAKIYTPGPELIKENITKKSYSLDTSANAIVLYEKVYFYIYISTKYGLCQHKYVHKIIKVLTDEGKQYSDVADMAPLNNYYYFDFSQISGKTYNWRDNKMTESILDLSTVRKEAASNNVFLMKFSMPDVSAGSIIEYEFCLDEPLTDIFGFWPFQEKIPKLYSEVELKANNNMLYRDVTKTLYAFKTFADDSDVADTLVPLAFYNSKNLGDNFATRRWVRKNVPAYYDETYVTNIANYLEKIFFQVSLQVKFTAGGSYKFINFDPNWKEINHRFLSNEYFLKELESPSFTVTKQVYYATKNAHDSLQLAKNIFRYVRDNFSNSTTGITYKQTLEGLIDEKRGTTYKINLLLIGMLRIAGFKCDPVLISTTANMHMNDKLPITDFINYMVTKVQVAGNDYYLDPANKYVPFGVIDSKCYNGYARVVTKDSGYAVDLTPDMIVNRNVTIAKTVDVNPEHYTLHVKHYFGNIDAAYYRHKWKDDTANVKGLIISEIDKDLEIESFHLANLNNPDTALVLEYTVSLKWQAATVYMPVFLYQFYSKNPFKEVERKYPIELPYAREDSYLLDLSLPKGYDLADSVTSAYYEFSPQTNFRYLAEYNASEKQLHLNIHLSERKTYLESTDYPFLKKFYSDIISAQQTAYVFKKR